MVVWKTEINRLRLSWAERTGGRRPTCRFAQPSEQIAVYKMARKKPTPRTRFWKNVELEVRAGKAATVKPLIATNGYKLIRAKLTPSLAQLLSWIFHQSVLVAADKVAKTDFDRAYVHDNQSIVYFKSMRRKRAPIDESFPSRLKSVPGANRAVLPGYTPFVEQKVQRRFL